MTPMRGWFCFFFCSLLCLSHALRGQSNDNGMPDVAWFDHVQQTTSASREQLASLTTALFHGLKEGKKVDALAALAPPEQTPRVVFITLGNESWPGRTYFGTGYSFQDALRVACEILQNNEPVFAKETRELAVANVRKAAEEGRKVPEWEARLENPGRWTWLRLDVVQATRPVANFNAQRSRIALTSLVGLAYGPTIGFSFTPDQLTGRCLMDEHHHLDRERVGNIISETYNWQALTTWLRVSGEQAGSRACLFETDVFWTDGGPAVRLYRGHRLEEDLPSAERCLAMATATAKRIASCLDLTTGQFRAPLPVWVAGLEGEKEHLATMALLSLTFSRLAAATGDSQFRQAASLALLPIRKAVGWVGSAKRQQVIKEDEHLAPNSMQAPRPVATPRTNALAALALLELADASAEDAGLARALGDFLKSQYAPGGDFAFNPGILVQEATVLTAPWLTFAEQVEADALAALALSRLGEKYPDGGFSGVAQKALAGIFEARIVQEARNQEFHRWVFSPWLMEAMTCLGRSDLGFVRPLILMGYAAVGDISTTPLYPDCYGALKGRPGCTLAARRSGFIGALAQTLRSAEKPALATEQLEGALPLLMFQVQAWLDTPASSITPSPAAYEHYFRDNLESYSFDLQGQIDQITSLMVLAPQLSSAGLLAQKRALKSRSAVRDETDRHPGPLTVDVTYSPRQDPTADTRAVTGATSNASATTTQVRAKPGVQYGRKENFIETGVKPAPKKKKK